MASLRLEQTSDDVYDGGDDGERDDKDLDCGDKNRDDDDTGHNFHDKELKKATKSTTGERKRKDGRLDKGMIMI